MNTETLCGDCSAKVRTFATTQLNAMLRAPEMYALSIESFLLQAMLLLEIGGWNTKPLQDHLKAKCQDPEYLRTELADDSEFTKTVVAWVTAIMEGRPL